MNIAVNFIKGILIGVANIIPGVSGGTMAVIMGIYERLTEAVGDFISNREKRPEYAAFLAVIAAGAAVGVLIFAKLFTWLLSSPVSTQHTYFFIAGLIIGSVPFIMKLHKDMKPSIIRVTLVLAAFVLVAALSALGGGEELTRKPEITSSLFGVLNFTEIDLNHNLWLAFCGFLSAGAMVLPGISGSALLVSLGEYGNVLYIIDKRLVIPAAFFGVGVIAGIVLFAKIISVLLKRYPSETIYFILGLIIASVYQIYDEIKGGLILAADVLAASLVSLIAGYIVSYLSSRVSKV
ncbi:MAG: DUF368 domain-containing protein [Clostridia bacterium]|nr:DUF368 domain-containing protein [Clostridia bacterium]